MIAGPFLGELFRVPSESEGGLVLGRDPTAGVRLVDDTSVSRRHAVVTADGVGARIRDLGSQNGTFVDGMRVGEAQLLDGQKVRVGQSVVFKFERWDDVEEKAQRHLVESALRDPPTRAFNRRYGLSRLDAELHFAERHRQPISLILAELESWKALVDRHGKQLGDEVLRRLVELWSTSLRAEDVVIRWGAHELAVILRGISPDDAAKTASRLSQKAHQAATGLDVPVTVKLGVATYPFADAPGDHLVDSLIKRAEQSRERR